MENKLKNVERFGVWCGDKVHWTANQRNIEKITYDKKTYSASNMDLKADEGLNIKQGRFILCLRYRPDVKRLEN